jgi:ADP-ribose pyrophosphatase YjhB (NUDIX family)
MYLLEMKKEILSREYPLWPLPAVGVLVISSSMILLIKRAFPPSAGKWSILGGVVELGERVEDAARREVREEVGLEIDNLKLLGVYDSIIRDSNGNIRYHYVIIEYLAKAKSMDVKPSIEVAEYRWVTIEDIGKLDTTPSLRELIRMYKNEIVSYIEKI